MRKIIYSVKKYKIIEMMKNYIQAGVFLFAVTEFLRLGKSRQALELLRESVYLKIQKKLKRKYRHILEETPSNFKSSHVSKRVWVCWFQGLDDAPEIVKLCIDSIKENFKGYEVIILTEKCIREYVTFPEVIERRLEKGQITLTHLSDLLRVELLVKYGGIWIDSTVLITDNNISSEIVDSDLFMFQELKPGSEGHSLPIS